MRPERLDDPPFNLLPIRAANERRRTLRFMAGLLSMALLVIGGHQIWRMAQSERFEAGVHEIVEAKDTLKHMEETDARGLGSEALTESIDRLRIHNQRVRDWLIEMQSPIPMIQTWVEQRPAEVWLEAILYHRDSEGQRMSSWSIRGHAITKEAVESFRNALQTGKMEAGRLPAIDPHWQVEAKIDELNDFGVYPFVLTLELEAISHVH